MRLSMKTAAIAAGFLLMGAFSASADEIGVDLKNNLGNVEVGKTYSLTAKGDYYQFTPAESGMITVQTNYSDAYGNIGYQKTSFFFMYDSSVTAGPNTWAFMDAQAIPEVKNGGYQFIFYVNGGQTYIFGYGNDVNTSLDFTVLSETPDAIPAVMTFCYPTPGTTFDLGLGLNDIILEFDQSIVSIESVSLDYTSKSGEAKSVTIPRNNDSGWEIFGTKVTVRIAYVNDIFQNAKDDANYDYPFYIKLNQTQGGAGPVTSANLADGGNQYVTCTANGDISIQYVFMDAVKLLSYSFPNTIYSYYAPGTPEGMATFTFDGPITVATQFVLQMGYNPRGSTGSGEEPDPSWTIPYTLSNDNTVLTLNFTGIDFSAGITKEYNQVTVLMNGIFGSNGLVADLNNGSGTLDFFPTYVNQPYGGAEVPEYISTKPTITPEPYEFLSSFQNVTVSWGETVSLVAGVTQEATVLVGTNGYQTVPVVVENGNMVIEFSKIVITNRFSGECTISVPAGLVKNAKGEVNDKMQIVYSVTATSGIESIGVDAESADIYNLNGVKVNKNNLRPGIYVIGGKKVVVK